MSSVTEMSVGIKQVSVIKS